MIQRQRGFDVLKWKPGKEWAQGETQRKLSSPVRFPRETEWFFDTTPCMKDITGASIKPEVWNAPTQVSFLETDWLCAEIWVACSSVIQIPWPKDFAHQTVTLGRPLFVFFCACFCHAVLPSWFSQTQWTNVFDSSQLECVQINVPLTLSCPPLRFCFVWMNHRGLVLTAITACRGCGNAQNTAPSNCDDQRMGFLAPDNQEINSPPPHWLLTFISRKDYD